MQASLTYKCLLFELFSIVWMDVHAHTSFLLPTISVITINWVTAVQNHKNGLYLLMKYTIQVSCP